MGATWSSADIPDLSGQRILVTGSNRGLGFASVVELAKKGCEVVMTARTLEKGEKAADEVRALVPGANLTVMALDLSSLQNVRDFAAEFKAKYESLTVLMNNAGVANTPRYEKVETEDGLELLWQTNVFAPFLLTNLLMETLAAAATTELPSRVIMLASVTHADPKNSIVPDAPDSVNLAKKPGKFWCYPVTKLADLMFSTTLHNKLESSSLKGKVLSVCAHPGFSSTDMTGPLGKVSNTLFGMDASQGCLSQVRAAVDPNVESGDYIGPNTTFYSYQHVIGPILSPNTTAEFYGYPVRGATRTEYSKDPKLGEALWSHAEKVTGAAFVLT